MKKFAVKSRLVLLFYLLFATNILVAQTHIHKFKDDVFISDWLICGAFPSNASENINTDFLLTDGGESKINPEFGKSYSSNSLPDSKASWQYAKAEASGKLNFRTYIEPNQRNVVYAASVIECENAQPVILKFGSNDRLKVWVNGKLIHFYSQVRAGDPDTDQIAVGLKKGKNLILAKVDNDGGNWWLYARYKKLDPIDENIFILGPFVNEASKRVSENEIADLFNVMIFNASTSPVNEVKFGIKKGKGRVEKSISTGLIKSGEFKWINIESSVSGEMKNQDLGAEVYLETPLKKQSFKISAERKNIQNGKMYMIQGFHVDPVWRDSQAGYQVLSFSNLQQHLRAAQVDPKFGLYLHEIPYLKPYYSEHPKERAMIREMVKSGQIETGGSYNQPNETTISGEAFIRNILYGRLYHENVLKDNPKVYTPWDVFGHIIQLPQILAKSEFIGTTWERGNYRSPFVRVPDIPDLYWSMSPDGTKILNRKIEYGFHDLTSSNFHDLDLLARKVMAEKLLNQRQQIPGIESDFLLDALDEKAPTPWYVGRSEIFDTFVPQVTTRPDGAEQYFKDVAAQEIKNKLDIPTVSRDESQYNEGCELSRFDLKMGNRLAENTIISAEKFGTIANLLGNPYSADALDKAWRQLINGQHHDGITGCGADVPYLDLTEAYHEALELSANALNDAQNFISDKIKTDQNKGIPLVVFNPLNWERDDILKTVVNFETPTSGFEIVDETGKILAFDAETQKQVNGKIESASVSFLAKQIPSLGYKTFWVVPSQTFIQSHSKTIASNIIENDFYKITTDKNVGGGIVSLIDKTSGKELIKQSTGHPGNELILLKEGAGFEPAWRFITTGEKSFSKDKACEIQVIENTISTKLIVTGEMDRMKKRVQEIVLYNDVPCIEFRTSLIDYKGMEGLNLMENDDRPRKDDRDLYCIGFPMDLDGAIPVLEDRFATKSYFKSKSYLEFHSTNVDWTSRHAMNSCNNWIDYSHSVKIDFGVAGSVAVGPSEIISSHNKSTRKLGFSLLEALAKRGVTSTPSYDSVERGVDILYRRFSFSLGIKGENTYTNKLLKTLSSAQKNQFETQLKKNGFAYFFTNDTNIDSAWFELPVLNIVGKDESLLEQAINIINLQLEESGTINLAPEVCKAKINESVPDYGVALLNRGNMAVSIENDGTMVMSLMHTVPWQTPLLSWTHDFPERKTHVFEYALYPHHGNWRDANLVKKGMEYNNPLMAKQTTSHNGDLPSSHSFFATKDNNVIVSAIKPKTNGNESYSGKIASDVKNGIIVRAYEVNGGSSEFELLSSFPIQNAARVNMMERNPQELTNTSNTFSTKIEANSIETFLISLKGEEIESTGKASAKKIYTSFWQNNEGAAPTGNLPVIVKLLGELESFNSNSGRTKVQQIEVAVCNDYTDLAIQGKIKIETPPGIRAVPTEIEYSVLAGGEKVFPVAVVIDGHGAEPGFVVATIEHKGDQIFDVLEYILPPKSFGHKELNDGQRLSWNSEINNNTLSININNPFAQTISGNVSIIGPVETWGMQDVNPIELMDVSDWKQSFEVKANGLQTLTFKLSGSSKLKKEDITAWLVAKLTYYGYIDYKSVLGNLEIIN